MYRKQHHGQLSIEAFHLPFGGTLDPVNRWVLLAQLLCYRAAIALHPLTQLRLGGVREIVDCERRHLHLAAFDDIRNFLRQSLARWRLASSQ